jgi:hypothetical protein
MKVILKKTIRERLDEAYDGCSSKKSIDYIEITKEEAVELLGEDWAFSFEHHVGHYVYAVRGCGSMLVTLKPAATAKKGTN